MMSISKPIIEDLGLRAEDLVSVDCGQPGPQGVGSLLVDLQDRLASDPEAAAGVLKAGQDSLSPEGVLIILGQGSRSVQELASLRNNLWPDFHVSRVYRMSAGGKIERTDVRGSTELDVDADEGGFVICASRRQHAMSQSVTTEKFDGAAAGWNSDPRSAIYGHYRWMRRLLAVLARPVSGEAVLDAGSGTGWVGLEAALRGASLSAFDPSPAMVRFVKENAQELGVEVDARVGFMEQAPFDTTFDLVLNSGVISFAPDSDEYLRGLDRLVSPGGRLVIGDLNPHSAGFKRRRSQRLVLPSREMSGLPRGVMVEKLAALGYEVEWVRYYQNTSPFPELMHRSRSNIVCWFLLQISRASSALDALLGSRAESMFDSWIVGARKRQEA